MKTLAILTSLLFGLVPSATAASIMPASETVLTITGLYTGAQCAQDESYWFITTGTATWNSFLSKTSGCQPVNATWEISSAKAGYLGNGCTLSFYTDTNCKENGVRSRLDECVTSSTAWKSFAIRDCDATKD